MKSFDREIDKEKGFPYYAVEVSPLTLSSIRQTGRINHVPMQGG